MNLCCSRSSLPRCFCAFQNTAVILPHVGFFLSWIASTSLHTCTQASELSCLSVFVLLSTSVWHFKSSSCANKLSSLFSDFCLQLLCHEAFLSLMWSLCFLEKCCQIFRPQLLFVFFGPSDCRLIHSSWFPTCAFFLSFRQRKALLCHGALSERTVFLVLFLWSDGEVDGDLRPMLHPAP